MAEKGGGGDHPGDVAKFMRDRRRLGSLGEGRIDSPASDTKVLEL